MCPSLHAARNGALCSTAGPTAGAVPCSAPLVAGRAASRLFTANSSPTEQAATSASCQRTAALDTPSALIAMISFGGPCVAAVFQSRSMALEVQQGVLGRQQECVARFSALQREAIVGLHAAELIISSAQSYSEAHVCMLYSHGAEHLANSDKLGASSCSTPDISRVKKHTYLRYAYSRQFR